NDRAKPESWRRPMVTESRLRWSILFAIMSTSCSGKDADREKEHPDPQPETASGVQERPPAKPNDGPLGMKFVPLPKATFYMGWGHAEWNGRTMVAVKECVKTEIKQEFEIAAHTVTQGQWQAVMGKNPSFFSRQGGGKNKVKDIKDEEL